MTSRARDLKAELIDAIVKRLDGRLPSEEASRAERFVRQYYGEVTPEDLAGFSDDTRYGEAMAIWRFAQQREPGKAKIRVYNPRPEKHGWHSTHTIVEIINDDMPFLVDSVAAALNRQDLAVHLLIHPILGIRRDGDGRLIDVLGAGVEAGDAITESVLHVEVSQQSAQETLDAIRDNLASVLADVRATVNDWRAMHAEVNDIISELGAAPAPLAEDEISEAKAFLEWIRDDNFTFLGFREYRLERVDGKDYLHMSPESGLGVLRRVTPESLKRSETPLSPEVSRFARRKQLLIITKANSRAVVHRPVYMDYIGVKRFDETGEVIGERRFIGLFTSTAYTGTPRDIPLLRRKVSKVFARSNFAPNSHNGKALLNILETYPRDELFQIDDDKLFEISHGILHLEVRQRIRLFIRRDSYARFYSCLVYVPRERYNTALRERMREILVKALHGSGAEYTVQVSEAVMARLHFIVRTPTVGRARRKVGVGEIEALLAAAARSWADDLRDACIDRWGEAEGMALFRRYRDAFPPAYRDDFNARTAVSDIDKIEGLAGADEVAMNLYSPPDAPEGKLHFKIYHPNDPVPLSDILPMLENMGLKVIEERPYRVGPEGNEGGFWIHDFSMTSRRGREAEVDRAKPLFEEAFAKIWFGDVENDGFNELVLGAGLTWREVWVLRAYCKFLRQADITFSDRYMEETLGKNAALARLLVELFLARFDPALGRGRDKRDAGIERRIGPALDAVPNLDEDRILRRFHNLIRATLRTNYFQTGADGAAKPYLSFKLDSRAIDELPPPRPWVEVFIHSPRVEALHLRGGKVARGGIRWSDRREDFRTEVLGLMKAQRVKNAVIVPVGAKGGFVVKRPPSHGGREALQDEVIACYKMMMSGLLDLTDNLVAGELAPPPRVVRHDDADPYLVVAADKGTATFSDIANAVANDYGFWLGDAFASGGSSGYDHKQMAITARGAWESVKRHFRELGADIQTTDFTCVGIGDMSGDVFGNGMLLSKHIKLIGAFNHLHVFFDPDPDPAASHRERKRLFAKPRSTWADYNPKRISKGGGVFDRKAKAVAVTPEMKKWLGITRDKLTPNELIKALLLAPVDLLWNGGIGTYVKASDESHAEVGDRANDAVRVDGKELRCRVAGEGGNLGITQRGRIEFALAGGRLNTDAIDNSAGVDCSDHEVNIKILLGGVVEGGDMTTKQRDALLARMTDEVAELVLMDNYQQIKAISIAEAQGMALLGPQARLMRSLERAGTLDRGLENLPDEEALAERQEAGNGLTRPELAVLLAYAKMALYETLLASDLPEDPYLAVDLLRYFPRPLRKRYRAAIGRHRLRRDIIAASATNSMVNRVGATFINQIVEDLGFSPSEIARAFIISRDAFDLRSLWKAVEGLDNAVPSTVQTKMALDIGRLVERSTMWFLRNRAHPLDIAATIDAFTPGIGALARRLDEVLSETRRGSLAQAAERYAGEGVPRDLARRVASLDALASALDIAQAARRRKLAVEEVGRVYFQVGERLGLDWLRASAGGFAAESHWQRQAVTAIVDELYSQQRDLAAAVLEANGAGPPGGAVDNWIAAHRSAVERNERLLADLRKTGAIDLAMLTVANRQIRALAAG
ncbi:MAG: NAD-glutamate dehydrogenase [Proteobacteria bacterium]|nr:NAD-glutamate dehydrogenase [Pseudomonadota bacterium]